MWKKKFFFSTDDSPPKAKITKKLLQGEVVVVYYLRMSATCHSAFRVGETKRLKTVLYVCEYRYKVSWTVVLQVSCVLSLSICSSSILSLHCTVCVCVSVYCRTTYLVLKGKV